MEELKIQPLTNDIDRNLKAQIDYFKRSGNEPLSNIFAGIKNEKDALFGDFQTGLLDQFDAFQSLINPSFNQFLNQSSRVAQEILPGIQSQYQQVQQQFGPNGELTNAATSYYKNLLDSVNSAISGNVAAAGNQGIRSGASQSSINQAVNQARSQGLGDLAKIQSEKLAQQQALYNNLFSLQDGLRQQQFNYENELIRNPLLQLNQLVSGLGGQLLTGLQGYDTAALQNELQKQAEQRALQQQLGLIGASSTSSNTGTNFTPEQIAALQLLQQQQQSQVVPVASGIQQGTVIGSDGKTYLAGT